MKVSILTPTDDVQLDWQQAYARLKQALALAGVEASAIAWTDFDPSMNLDALASLAWGYHFEPDRWTRLLSRVREGGIANSARSLLWNSDKIYLKDLEQQVPIVPTHFVSRLDEAQVARYCEEFETRTLIVKPRWGASGHGLKLVRPGTPLPTYQGQMVQPKLKAIEREGELSLIYFGGVFSHAVRKLAAAGEFRVQSDFGGTVEAVSPDDELVALGSRALRAAPDELCYARIDLLMGDDGRWQLSELEAIEPELFLEHAPDQGRRFGEAVRQTLFNT